VPGVSWTQALKEALSKSSTVLILVGGHGLGQWQNMEVRSVIERAVRDSRLNIIPVLMPDVDLDDLPPTLRSYSAIDLCDTSDYQTKLRRLAASLAVDPDTGDHADDEEIGDRLRESGDLNTTLPYYQKALTVAEAKIGNAHPHIARLRREIGVVHLDMGNLVAAESEFSIALTVDESTYGSDHIRVAANLNNLTRVYEYRGEYERARVILECALSITRASDSDESLEVATCLNNLTSVVRNMGDLTTAQRYLEEALEITTTSLG